MNKYPVQLREKVNSLIGEMEKSAYLFSKNGEKDFGLFAFHSKKAEFICQEVFARLIFYNLCEMVVSHAAIFHRTASHVYQLNFSQAVHILRRFFSLAPDAPPLDVISLILKYLLPVRSDRCSPRKVHCRSAASFIYRIA